MFGDLFSILQSSRDFRGSCGEPGSKAQEHRGSWVESRTKDGRLKGLILWVMTETQADCLPSSFHVGP